MHSIIYSIIKVENRYVDEERRRNERSIVVYVCRPKAAYAYTNIRNSERGRTKVKNRYLISAQKI